MLPEYLSMTPKKLLAFGVVWCDVGFAFGLKKFHAFELSLRMSINIIWWFINVRSYLIYRGITAISRLKYGTTLKPCDKTSWSVEQVLYLYLIGL